MPVHIGTKKINGKTVFCPVDETGKVLSTGKCSANRKKVAKQVAAVNISLIHQGKIKLKKGQKVPPKKSK